MLLKTYHNNLNAFSISCSGNNINHLCLIYRKLYKHYEVNHGRKFAVKRMKDFNAIAERFAMHQPIEAINFLKSDKDGYPKVLNPYKALLRDKDPYKVKIVLSIFRSVEILRLPPDRDISTVLQPLNVKDEVVNDIIKYIPKFINKFKLKLKYRDLFYHFTVKNGPNGPALQTSDTDYSAVKSDEKLYEALCYISNKFEDTKLPEEDEYTHKEGIHSKLTQFSEKAGKTRTIAVVDYYSQRALRPLHDSLMRILKSIPSDGTYCQDNVGSFAQVKTSEKSFVETSDMTAFTDLFPAVIQRELLFHLEEDENLAKSFWTLLAERTFTLAWDSSVKVKYGSGQPMGAYASWALCTLAHHLIVNYCSEVIGFKSITENYRIIGDDNIISNEKVSTLYQKVLSDLGCKLNKYKGTRSQQNSEYSSAEVAKRLYCNGINISPLTPGILKDLTSPLLLNSGLEDLLMIYEDHALPCRILSTMIRKDHRERSWLLCLNPINGVIKPGMPGYENYSLYWDESLPPEHYKEVMLQVRRESLINKANLITDERIGPYGSFARMTMRSKLKEDSGHSGNDIVPHYAQLECRRHILSRMRTTLERIDDACACNYLDQLLDEVEYLPDPKNPFMDMKDLRRIHTSLLVETVLLRVKSEKEV